MTTEIQYISANASLIWVVNPRGSLTELDRVFAFSWDSPPLVMFLELLISRNDPWIRIPHSLANPDSQELERVNAWFAKSSATRNLIPRIPNVQKSDWTEAKGSNHLIGWTISLKKSDWTKSEWWNKLIDTNRNFVLVLLTIKKFRMCSNCDNTLFSSRIWTKEK